MWKMGASRSAKRCWHPPCAWRRTIQTGRRACHTRVPAQSSCPTRPHRLLSLCQPWHRPRVVSSRRPSASIFFSMAKPKNHPPPPPLAGQHTCALIAQQIPLLDHGPPIGERGKLEWNEQERNLTSDKVREDELIAEIELIQRNRNMKEAMASRLQLMENAMANDRGTHSTCSPTLVWIIFC